MHDLSHDVSCGAEALTLDMVVTTAMPGAMRRGFSLMKLMLEQPDFDIKALERLKQRVEVSYKSLAKSVERRTAGA